MRCTITAMKHPLYPRWIAANALGELFGLGATILVFVIIATRLSGGGVIHALLGFALSVAAGALEATLVGLGQWWAMRPWFPTISARVWWRATLIGALAAYVLGFLPSTIIDLINAGQPAGGSAPMAEPPQAVVLLLAAGLGLVGGALLSFAQWRVLRRHSRHAGCWIPANMLAWMLAMPLLFWAIDLSQKGQPAGQAAVILALALLAAGALVGALHGLALVQIARAQNKQTRLSS